MSPARMNRRRWIALIAGIVVAGILVAAWWL